MRGVDENPVEPISAKELLEYAATLIPGNDGLKPNHVDLDDSFVLGLMYLQPFFKLIEDGCFEWKQVDQVLADKISVINNLVDGEDTEGNFDKFSEFLSVWLERLGQPLALADRLISKLVRDGFISEDQRVFFMKRFSGVGNPQEFLMQVFAVCRFFYVAGLENVIGAYVDIGQVPKLTEDQVLAYMGGVEIGARVYSIVEGVNDQVVGLVPPVETLRFRQVAKPKDGTPWGLLMVDGKTSAAVGHDFWRRSRDAGWGRGSEFETLRGGPAVVEEGDRNPEDNSRDRSALEFFDYVMINGIYNYVDRVYSALVSQVTDLIELGYLSWDQIETYVSGAEFDLLFSDELKINEESVALFVELLKKLDDDLLVYVLSARDTVQFLMKRGVITGEQVDCFMKRGSQMDDPTILMQQAIDLNNYLRKQHEGSAGSDWPYWVREEFGNWFAMDEPGEQKLDSAVLGYIDIDSDEELAPNNEAPDSDYAGDLPLPYDT